MKTLIQQEQWARREHFAFFGRMSNPMHSLTTQVSCEPAYRYCREHGISFFLHYLHQTLIAVNACDNLRYRVEGDNVVQYDTIHANTTIGRPDHSFGFCPVQFDPDFQQFRSQAEPAMQAVISAGGLCFNEECQRQDVIHFSAIPWVAFEGLTHAYHNGFPDSVPKVSVGKLHQRDGKLVLPVATFAHHGLADAYHIHQFFERLEYGLNHPPCLT